MRATSSIRASGSSASTRPQRHAVLDLLGHAPVMGAKRGDLRGVGDHQHLPAVRQSLQSAADRGRRGAAHPRGRSRRRSL